MKNFPHVSFQLLIVLRFVRSLFITRMTRPKVVVYLLAAGSTQFFMLFLSSAQEASPSPSPTLISSDEKQTIELQPSTEAKAETITQNWAIHGDAIEVLEGQPGFHLRYPGHALQPEGTPPPELLTFMAR